MKCPKCKKPSELQTKRTKANGRAVTRERFCPKCKNRFVTIERFDTDIAEHDSQYKREIGELESNNRALEYQIKGYTDIFIGIKNAMDLAVKKK